MRCCWNAEHDRWVRGSVLSPSYPRAMSPQQQHRTSGWPPTRNEWIGLAVALVIGTLLVVVLGWFGALR